jgi:hypothetical protein
MRDYGAAPEAGASTVVATPTQANPAAQNATPAASASAGAPGLNAGAVAESPEAPAAPYGTTVVAIPFGEGAPEEVPRTNVAPLSPRSVAYTPGVRVR